MWGYIVPIAVIILSGGAYQICTKSSPAGMDPFAVLTVTYGIGTVLSFVLFYFVNRNENVSLLAEYGKINWAPILLGISIIGLEAGYLYAYKAGWKISAVSITQCSVLTILLTFIGIYFYHEVLTWNKILGIAICLVGLVFMHIK